MVGLGRDLSRAGMHLKPKMHRHHQGESPFGLVTKAVHILAQLLQAPHLARPPGVALLAGPHRAALLQLHHSSRWGTRHSPARPAPLQTAWEGALPCCAMLRPAAPCCALPGRSTIMLRRAPPRPMPCCAVLRPAPPRLPPCCAVLRASHLAGRGAAAGANSGCDSSTATSAAATRWRDAPPPPTAPPALRRLPWGRQPCTSSGGSGGNVGDIVSLLLHRASSEAK